MFAVREDPVAVENVRNCPPSVVPTSVDNVVVELTVNVFAVREDPVAVENVIN